MVTAPKRTYKRVQLPWAMTTDGVARLMREWKNAPDARTFKDKHNLDIDQWKKVVELMKLLRAKFPKIKVMKLHASPLDGLDFDVLAKVAKDLEM